MRADRLIALILLLQARGRVTAPELAAQLEVSARTIYRDLDALSAAGVPVYAERGTGGGIALPDGYRVDLTALNREEASALFLSSVPGPLADLGAGQVLDAALRKLSAALPAAARQEAEAARQRVHLDPAEWWQTHEPVPYLRTIQEAVWQDRRLRLSYRRRGGGVATRLVDPYGLVAKASVWYLVAADAEDAVGVDSAAQAGQDPAAQVPAMEPRVFRVSRVEAADLVDEPSRRPDGFDLGIFWRAWCADFERSRPSYAAAVRVAPSFVPVLPQVLGEGAQRLIADHGRWEADGAMVLPLTFESLDVACSKLLGFGPSVEVLSPPELRARVAQQAASVASLYACAD